MLGYAQRYGVRDVLLLYPHHREMGNKEGVQHRFQILGSDCGQSIHVATVDLRALHTVPKQLETLATLLFNGADRIAQAA